MQAEFEELATQRQDLEARELEVQCMTQTHNLNAGRDARVTTATSVAGSRDSRKKEPASRCASSQIASQRSRTHSRAPPAWIKVISTGITPTLAPPIVSTPDGASQKVKAMVQDIVKSSPTQLGVIPQDTPTQSQAESLTKDPKPPQIEDISSEGEIIIGYHTHNLEGCVPSPESLVIHSKPPPTERTTEAKHPDDPRERVDITSGSFSIHASQLKENEALARKTAAAFSNALSLAKYLYNQPEISEESKAGLHHLKLDLMAGSNFAWRTVHNNMLMRHSVALDNLSGTVSKKNSDQKEALLHAPFKGTTLFEGELAKLHRANKESASSVTVYPAASPQTYSTKPYADRGRSFRKCGSPFRRGGRDRGQGRSTPSATTTKTIQV